MEDVKNLIRTSIEGAMEALTTGRAVGEPIVIGGNTIIPLMSVGIGFGGGGGTGKGGRSEKETGEGIGGGTGGGGGVKPVAVIIVNQEGVRVESIKGSMSSLAESVSELAVKVMDKRKGEDEDKTDDESK
jgi:uncharacterized spore protein YtfJ